MSRHHFTTPDRVRKVAPYRPPTAAPSRPPRQGSLFDPGPATAGALSPAKPLREPGCDDDEPLDPDAWRWVPVEGGEGGEP